MKRDIVLRACSNAVEEGKIATTGLSCDPLEAAHNPLDPGPQSSPDRQIIHFSHNLLIPLGESYASRIRPTHIETRGH